MEIAISKSTGTGQVRHLAKWDIPVVKDESLCICLNERRLVTIHDGDGDKYACMKCRKWFRP